MTTSPHQPDWVVPSARVTSQRLPRAGLAVRGTAGQQASVPNLRLAVGAEGGYYGLVMRLLETRNFWRAGGVAPAVRGWEDPHHGDGGWPAPGGLADPCGRRRAARA